MLAAQMDPNVPADVAEGKDIRNVSSGCTDPNAPADLEQIRYIDSAGCASIGANKCARDFSRIRLEALLQTEFAPGQRGHTGPRPA